MFRDIKPDSRGHLEEATMLSFFGRIIDNDELFELAAERHADNPRRKQNLLGTIRIIKVHHIQNNFKILLYITSAL